MSKNSLEVAKVIYQQIGGARLKVMTGARDFTAHNDKCGALAFKLPRFVGVKINYIKIILNQNDLYDIEFSKVSKTAINSVSNLTDIFAEDLVDCIESETGLCLSLNK